MNMRRKNLMDVLYQLTELRDILYVVTNCLQARIELEAMLAENQSRVVRNESPIYREPEILELINKYGIHHNGVVSTLYPKK